MAESEEELKSVLIKVKEREKVGSKLNIQKTEVMASGPIISWHIDGATMKTVTADGDCRHEIKRCLLLGRTAMTNLDRVLKRNDISLLTKVHIVKTDVSSSHVWM